MAKLTLSPNLTHPDDFYASLISAHDGLSEDESTELNARIILIMANQIGDQGLLEEILHKAKLAE